VSSTGCRPCSSISQTRPLRRCSSSWAVGRQPYVKGFDSMINSVYNGWRFEDLWLDK
jgi:hypothetical protein